MDRYKLIKESVLSQTRHYLAQIYCDMDDVLVDFVGHIKTTFGQDINLWKGWKQEIPKIEQYWEEIPPRRDAHQLMDHIEKYHPLILTAYASWDLRSIHAKKHWMKKNFNIDPSRVFVVQRHEKKQYATKNGKPSVLIDDYLKNIIEWQNAGGIGIQHIAASQTIDQLKTLGFG